MPRQNIDLDAELPAAERDWTKDERALVIVAANNIASDDRLTLEEQIDFLIALINKPLSRRLS